MSTNVPPRPAMQQHSNDWIPTTKGEHTAALVCVATVTFALGFMAGRALR